MQETVCASRLPSFWSMPLLAFIQIIVLQIDRPLTAFAFYTERL